jgi:hypothetical protein
MGVVGSIHFDYLSETSTCMICAFPLPTCLLCYVEIVSVWLVTNFYGAESTDRDAIHGCPDSLIMIFFSLLPLLIAAILPRGA